MAFHFQCSKLSNNMNVKRQKRLKSSLKIKFGLLSKSVVLGVFLLYALLIGAASSYQTLAGQPSTETSLSTSTTIKKSRSLVSNATISSNATVTSDKAGCSFDNMGEGTYPNHLLTCEQMKAGAIILPIIGCAFMFIGLAIVCDDFFVPALETISWRLDLTDDVAGESTCLRS